MSVRPKPMSSKMSLFFFYEQFLATFVGRQNFFYYICIALLFLNILKLYFPQQNKNKIVLRASPSTKIIACSLCYWYAAKYF